MIRGTASGRLFKEIVFSATKLAAINWNGDVIHDLGQRRPHLTFDITSCSFKGHPRSMTLADPIHA